LQSGFGLRPIRLHLPDSGLEVGAPRGGDFGSFAEKRIGRLSPRLCLRGGNVPERGLLQLDLLIGDTLSGSAALLAFWL